MASQILAGTVIAYAGQINDPSVPGKPATVVHVPAAGSGWLLCNGAPLSKSQYQSLWTSIGNAHGDGRDDPLHQSDFNLPDFRGYFLRGVTGVSPTDPEAASRAANPRGGNAQNFVGSVQTDQVGAHNHSVHDPGHAHVLQMDSGGLNIGYAGESINCTSGSWYKKSGQTVTSGSNVSVNPNEGSETRPKNAYVHWLIFAG